MSRNFYLSILLVCYTIFSFSQINENDILFTIDNEPIKAKEFLRVYNKNLDLVKDESQKDIDAYLKLFINYQLKVKEASALGLDQNASYKREFLSYKNQLTKNFMSDNKVTDALVKEAYDRMLYDVKASHILIRIDEAETDTLQVYNDILKLRDRVINEGYDKVQKEVHDGKTIFAENLGYFTVLRMVYPFENKAYNTKVGEVSMPFRTRFGFHIVQVEDKRPSRGEVTIQHIMVSNNQNDTLLIPEVRIKEIYQKLNQGEKFESLAKQFSDDKSSSAKGGLMNPFTGGQLNSPEFEDKAFALNEIGQVSEPFETVYGWHIVKLVEKNPIQPFDKLKPELEQKIKRDSRSSLINSALVSKLKEKYNVIENKEAITYFETLVTNEYFNNAWVLPTDIGQQNVFTIKSKNYSYTDFANHLMSVQKSYYKKDIKATDVIKKEYNAFLEQSILKYHEDNLEYENEDFANVLKEYRDGLLLFDLMEQQVWNKAITDTVGLKTYYINHKENYFWNDRVDAIVATAADETDIDKVIQLYEKGESIDAIKSQLNTEKSQKVIFTKDIMEANHQALPEDFEFKEGISKTYFNNDAYHVVFVSKLLPKGLKSFDEAKGKIVSDYQNYIEDSWLKELNSKYKVEVNQDVLNKVKSNLLH
jgi:peptidyl-prolyl cis-trans isomerase SurA